jgi:hypothetical protein
VVARDLLELAVAQPVRPAVADVTEAYLLVVDLGGGERRAHPAARLVGHGEVVDAPVRLAQDARELRLGGRVRRACFLEGVGGDGRGDLARARAAHPVSDREERRPQHQRVLVGAALAAHVGAADLLDDAESHAPTPRSDTRCRRCGSRPPS